MRAHSRLLMLFHMKKTTSLLTGALLLTLGIMILAGLKPKGFRIRNEVAWLHSSPGLCFGRNGIAFTQDYLTWPAGAPDNAITIEMSVKASRAYANGVPNILTLWDGAASDVLVVGQWKNHLVIRTKDRTARKGFRETGAVHALPKDTVILITIASGGDGTVVYVNGRPGGRGNFPLVAASGLSARLVLGNSPSGGSPWRGNLYGVTIFARKLGPPEIAGRFLAWDSLGRAWVPPAPDAMVRYAFDEGRGDAARNSAGNNGPGLTIPVIFRILQHKVLVLPWKDFRLDKSYAGDATVNFAGFMPLGFLLASLLMTGLAMKRRRAVALAVLSGFLLSLFIELAQVWIPTRSSQMSDLILNTLGAWAGTIFARSGKTGAPGKDRHY